MNLLLYSHFFAPSIGGVETVMMSLARGLAGFGRGNGSADFDVMLVTETPARDFDDSSLPFRVVRRPGIAALRRLVRGADVVHVAGPALWPIVLSLAARKPVVVEHHGFQTNCPNGQLLIEPQGIPCPGHFMARNHRVCLRCNSGQGWLASYKLWLFTFVRRFLCRHIACNIMPTKWLATTLNLPRAITIPHGLQPIAALSLAVPESSRAPVITFQGRLVNTKGVRLLFEAAKILSEQGTAFDLQVIGDGPERPTLGEMAQRVPLAGHVRFTGRLTEPQLEKALSESGVVVVPSLGGEVFGLVVAENMMRGLPVIASDLGAFAEVVGEAGLVFPTGNAAELARQIAKVLADATLRKQLAVQGRQRALACCDLGRMLEAHARIYRDLVP